MKAQDEVMCLVMFFWWYIGYAEKKIRKQKARTKQGMVIIDKVG